MATWDGELLEKFFCFCKKNDNLTTWDKELLELLLDMDLTSELCQTVGDELFLINIYF
jgi:hypothetical protein